MQLVEKVDTCIEGIRYSKKEKNPHTSYHQYESDLLYKNAVKRCNLSGEGAHKSCMM